MSCDKILPMLNDFALMLTNATETKQVESHLATGCQTCGQRLTEIQAAISLLADDLTPTAPPVYLKSELLQQIRVLKHNAGGPRNSKTSTWPIETVTSGSTPTDSSSPAFNGSEVGSGRIWRELSIAFAACLLGIVGSYALTRKLSNIQTERPALAASKDRPVGPVGRIASPERDVKNVRFVSSSVSGNRSDKSNTSSRWYVVVDPYANQVHVSVQASNRLGLNRRLDAWLTTFDGIKVELGQLENYSNDMWHAIFDLNINADIDFRISVAEVSSESMTFGSEDTCLDVALTMRGI